MLINLNDKISLAIGAVVGVVAFGSIFAYRKFQDLTKKVNSNETILSSLAKTLNSSVENLAKKTPVDIEQTVIDMAVDRAVEREASVQVSRAASNAVRVIREDMDAQVRRSVTSSYSNIEQSVSNEIARQVASIDIDRLKEDVTAKAKKAVLAKFEGQLDDIAGDFKKNLKSVSQFYNSVSSPVTPNTGIVLKLTK